MISNAYVRAFEQVAFKETCCAILTQSPASDIFTSGPSIRIACGDDLSQDVISEDCKAHLQGYWPYIGSAYAAACPEIDMAQGFAAADVTTACKNALGIPCNANKEDDLVDPDCTREAAMSSFSGPGFDCGMPHLADETACTAEASCAWRADSFYGSCVCDGLADTEWRDAGCRAGGGQPQQVHHLLQTRFCSECLVVV